jgi:secreted trypsin-like serine protease
LLFCPVQRGGSVLRICELLPVLIFSFLLFNGDSTSAQDRGRIVGGITAEPSRWPSVVSLQGQGIGHFCGGTVIAPQWILTAAHCLEVTREITVILGRNDLKSESQGVEVLPELVVVHSGFDAFTLENDIALIRVRERLVVPPVEIVTQQEFREARSRAKRLKFTVVGWGLTQESGEISSQLRETRVRLANRRSCSKAYEGFNTVTSSMICAGSRRGHDACDGDSGGPLFMQVSPGQESKQIGITSWGLGCGRPRYPGVYTDPSRFRDWIDLVLNSFPK